ncbi:GNAT family N-acetyltransferase [Falsiroseomonas stagni]|uniref:GNAT family N-acetyltransferase n=1 Tax=Falsiroseomonas stagni TaxID=484882 RepID=UPI0015877DEC|nr:GNAT family N-acetyltransferase [Falsiroseomonas stagni]
MREEANSGLHVASVTPATLDAAVALLVRFFREEGFATPPDRVRQNAALIAADQHHWIGLATLDAAPVGVVTVTTALYVEWGRLGEIGDLYVAPESRRRGVAQALLDAAERRCAGLGCSSLSVVVTRDGEARHGLHAFYARQGFLGDGRQVLTRPLGKRR